MSSKTLSSFTLSTAESIRRECPFGAGAAAAADYDDDVFRCRDTGRGDWLS